MFETNNENSCIYKKDKKILSRQKFIYLKHFTFLINCNNCNFITKDEIAYEI